MVYSCIIAVTALSLSLFLSLLWFIVASALSLALSPPYCCVVFTIVTPSVTEIIIHDDGLGRSCCGGLGLLVILSLSQRRRQHSTLSLSAAAAGLNSLSLSAVVALSSLSLSGDSTLLSLCLCGGGTHLSLSQRRRRHYSLSLSAGCSLLSLSLSRWLSLLLSLSLSAGGSLLSLSLSGRPLSPLSFLSAQRAFEMCLGGGRILYCIGDSNYFRLTFWLLSPILMVTLLKKRQ